MPGERVCVSVYRVFPRHTSYVLHRHVRRVELRGVMIVTNLRVLRGVGFDRSGGGVDGDFVLPRQGVVRPRIFRGVRDVLNLRAIFVEG